VRRQRADERSILSLYRALIRLRRREPALSVGVLVKAEAIGSVLTFQRFHAGRWLIVALNLSDEPQFFKKADAHDVLISTHLDRNERESGGIRLRANEGIVLAA
jgi:alpha-glucosidase